MRNYTSGSFLVAKETKKTIFYVYVKRMLIYQHFFYFKYIHRIRNIKSEPPLLEFTLCSFRFEFLQQGDHLS